MKYTFDDFMNDSKEFIDMISVKAADAASVSKAYVEKAQIKVKLREKYYQLGKLCYAMHRDDIDETGNMKRIIEEIKELEKQQDFADEAAGKPRVCPSCGAKNSAADSYCAKCGCQL